MINLQQELAEAEFGLAEALFLEKNYKESWKAYQQSLMRDFDDNKEHKIRVYFIFCFFWKYKLIYKVRKT